MKRKRKAPKQKQKYIKVTSRSYGAKLKGAKIYYEGKKPKGLKSDGSILFGKHILELIQSKFGPKTRWTITGNTDSIAEKYNIFRVHTSNAMLARMGKESWDRTRDIKTDIVRNAFANAFPSHFKEFSSAPAYVPGTLSKLLTPGIAKRLSGEDRDALQKFLPDFIASESMKSVNLLKAAAQIKSLKELAADLRSAMSISRAESWWQAFIKEKILIIQQGYIKAIEKINIAVGNTKFPDFSLVTHDSYLDILEIKKPDTPLIKYDAGRGNYYADPELSRAIIQVENYIETITAHKDAIRSHLKDEYKLDLKVVRPRGIILAGDASALANQKERDDLRLLAHGLKNITIVTYDELLSRLNNYIKVLDETTRASIQRKRKPHRTTHG